MDASLRVSHLLHHQRPRDETDSYAGTGRNRQPAGLDKKQDDVVFVVGRELRTGRRKSRPGPARRGRRETAVGAGEGKTGQHWGRAVEPQWVVQLRLPGRHKISPPRQRPSQAGVRSQRCQKLLQMPRKRPALLGSDAASFVSHCLCSHCRHVLADRPRNGHHLIRPRVACSAWLSCVPGRRPGCSENEEVKSSSSSPPERAQSAEAGPCQLQRETHGGEPAAVVVTVGSGGGGLVGSSTHRWPPVRTTRAHNGSSCSTPSIPLGSATRQCVSGRCGLAEAWVAGQ